MEKGEPMKLIKADEAFRVLSDYYHHRTETQADALREALELVPEAVVRFGDCEYYTAYNECTCPYGDIDQNNYTYVDEDEYCSYGKRRTDETD